MNALTVNSSFSSSSSLTPSSFVSSSSTPLSGFKFGPTSQLRIQQEKGEEEYLRTLEQLEESEIISLEHEAVSLEREYFLKEVLPSDLKKLFELINKVLEYLSWIDKSQSTKEGILVNTTLVSFEENSTNNIYGFAEIEGWCVKEAELTIISKQFKAGKLQVKVSHQHPAALRQVQNALNWAYKALQTVENIAHAFSHYSFPLSELQTLIGGLTSELKHARSEFFCSLSPFSSPPVPCSPSLGNESLLTFSIQDKHFVVSFFGISSKKKGEVEPETIGVSSKTSLVGQRCFFRGEKSEVTEHLESVSRVKHFEEAVSLLDHSCTITTSLQNKIFALS